MVLIDALSWWYSWGWFHVYDVMRLWLKKLYSIFSVRQMGRTLFAPWKEDRVDGAQGLDQMMKALLMNSVARLIGFTIRMIFLSFYAFLSLAVLIFGLGLLLVWPILPVSGVLVLIAGVLL
ncbi:MAG: hypothetical protein WCI47_03560 [bacterium]